ncbi:hypothetical protein [Bradyrhizobium sp. CSA207]|uniref:hypothetical protein n=1 Tax=Bradyrhizobium sp. CSA207 TaxID=2698826 RepID=UPI0023B03DEE|nr:hypothetical protein [Bradyrhizobium sp. CSA207]
MMLTYDISPKIPMADLREFGFQNAFAPDVQDIAPSRSANERILEVRQDFGNPVGSRDGIVIKHHNDFAFGNVDAGV